MGPVQQGKSVALERGMNRSGKDRGKRRDEGTGGRRAFVLLSFLVFLGSGQDTEGRAAERHEEEGVRLVDAMPFLSWSRCPKAVERERGGSLRTRVDVSRGIPWIYPRE